MNTLLALLGWFTTGSGMMCKYSYLNTAYLRVIYKKIFIIELSLAQTSQDTQNILRASMGRKSP